MTLLVAASLLAGCSAPGTDDGPSGSTPSPSRSASQEAAASPSDGSAPPSAFTPDPSLVPGTAKDGQSLVDAVVLTPADWGRGFVAQEQAESAPGTWAVLDDSCRWEREKLPGGVLASVSRYSTLPAGSGKGTVKVTAVATAHASVLSADD